MKVDLHIKGKGCRISSMKLFRGKNIGILYILLAAFCFSIMTLTIRLAGDLPVFQKAFFRNAIAAVIATVILARSEQGFKIKKGSMPSLVARASFGLMGIITNFWATDHLLLPDANILNKLSPFFAIIISVFILKEIPTKFEWGCVVFAFIGALFVVQPTSGLASLPAFVGMFSGLCAGTAYVFVRKLGTHGERGPVIVFFFSVFSTVILCPLMIMTYEPMTIQQFLILLICGISAAGGQLCITAAYTYAPAKEISVFDYSQVMFAAIWGFIFFGEIPNLLSFIGYGIIIVTAVVKWYHGLRKDHEPCKDSPKKA